jgi:hypothetical protein
MLTTYTDSDIAAATTEAIARPRRRSGLVPTVLAGLVAVTGLLPLIRNQYFYYWDDTAAAFMPGWHAIGTRLLDGSLPFMLPEFWSAGNFAAESLYGLYNPVIMADSVVIALLPDLAVGAIVVKLQFMVILAIGVYLLCREYGARTRFAFVAGFAMPFAGYTMYFDAVGWMSALIAFSWIPHVWWSTRGAAQGRRNPLIAIVFGYLAMSTGNPYGAVGVVVVYMALLVELLVNKHWTDVRTLVVSGAAVALTGSITYLPLLLTTSVTVRSQSDVANDGSLVPSIGDVLNLSSPTALPHMQAFASIGMTVPVGYLAWFIVPLLPWIRWHSVARLRSAAVSLAVFAGAFTLLTLAPSNLWMFRWPLRLLEYLQLPALVVIAVALSAGLHRTHLQRRALITTGLLLLQVYLAWAGKPDLIGTHAIGFGVTVALAALTLTAYYRRPSSLAPALAAGGLVLMVLQSTQWFTGNYNFTPWKFPHNVAQLHDQFAERYPGTTFVVSIPAKIPPGQHAPYPQWNDLLSGSAWHTAGVRSVNGYSGISFEHFVNALCIAYYGGTPCADTIPRLVSTSPGTALPWYDAMKLDTIVVQNSGGYDDIARVLPPNWQVSDEGGVTVARRLSAQPWPDGRLAEATPGLTASSDSTPTDQTERVSVTGSGTLTFARLAWPGYSAQLDGHDIPVSASPGGLLQVAVPSSAPRGSQVTIKWATPGSGLAIGLFAAGALLAAGQLAVRGVNRRRRRLLAPPD